MQKLKYNALALVIGIAIGLLLFKQCAKDSYKEEVTYKTVVNTTYSTHIDTIPFIDTQIYSKLFIDTVTFYDIFDTDFFTFKSIVNDSLIEGEITTNLSIKDDRYIHLTSQDILYTPKFPQYIHQIDTVKIHRIDSITINNIKDNQKKFSLLLGLSGITDAKNINVFLKAGVSIKTNNFYYGFDPINKYHQVGYLKEINIK